MISDEDIDEVVRQMNLQLSSIVSSECKVGTGFSFLCTNAHVYSYSRNDDGKFVFEYQIKVIEQ